MTAPRNVSYRLAAHDIDGVRATFGVGETQVRRDFAISWMLWAIAESTTDVVFLGGTALNRTLLHELRLSEDIDLMPIGPRSQVATAIHDGFLTRLERGFGRVVADVPLPATRHPTASVYVVGGQQVRVQLVDRGAYAWPWHGTRIHQRYFGCPPISMNTLTSEGFAAAKTAAWCERNAPRDLYDLWALANAGHISPRAADTFRRLGPTNRWPSPSVFPATPPSAQQWHDALSHQCIPKVSPAEAYLTVVNAWRDATRPNADSDESVRAYGEPRA